MRKGGWKCESDARIQTSMKRHKTTYRATMLGMQLFVPFHLDLVLCLGQSTMELQSPKNPWIHQYLGLSNFSQMLPATSRVPEMKRSLKILLEINGLNWKITWGKIRRKVPTFWTSSLSSASLLLVSIISGEELAIARNHSARSEKSNMQTSQMIWNEGISSKKQFEITQSDTFGLSTLQFDWNVAMKWEVHYLFIGFSALVLLCTVNLLA